jgi:hypothetical protein
LAPVRQLSGALPGKALRAGLPTPIPEGLNNGLRSTHKCATISTINAPSPWQSRAPALFRRLGGAPRRHPQKNSASSVSNPKKPCVNSVEQSSTKTHALPFAMRKLLILKPMSPQPHRPNKTPRSTSNPHEKTTASTASTPHLTRGTFFTLSQNRKTTLCAKIRITRIYLRRYPIKVSENQALTIIAPNSSNSSISPPRTFLPYSTSSHALFVKSHSEFHPHVASPLAHFLPTSPACLKIHTSLPIAPSEPFK